MFDDNDTGIETDDKSLGKQDFQIISRGVDIVSDPLRVVDKAIIVGTHIEMEVESLSRKRHFKKCVAVNDGLRKHSLFCHDWHLLAQNGNSLSSSAS